MATVTSDEPEPLPVPGRWRLLAASGVLALAGFFAVWGLQPELHLTMRAEFGACMWLFAYSIFALNVFAFGRRPAARAAKLLALGSALRALPAAAQTRPANYPGPIARRTVYRACGYISAVSIGLAVFTDVCIATGALDLDGPNYRILMVALLFVGCQCALGRLLGVQVAAAELAEQQMLTTAHLAVRETGSPDIVRLERDRGAHSA